MSEIKGRSAPEGTLPVKVASSDDATANILGMRLEEGHNHLARNKAGLELMVKATAGERLEYVILNRAGDPVDEVIDIQVVNRKEKKTTCWKCGEDENGDIHCWQIPCPVIVGPWKPGKVVTQGFVLI